MIDNFPPIPHTTLHEIFSEQVKKNPDKVALVDKEIQLTYNELNQMTNSLAHYLSNYKIEEGDPVGILMNKSYEYIVACIAILKAGGAYLHLELAYPDQFLQQIFEDARPKVVITKLLYQKKIISHNIEALCIDNDCWLEAVNTEVKRPTSNSSVAIIGYSSGTTGKPKGVCVSHRATIYAHYKFWEEVWAKEEKGRFAYTTFLTWDAVSPMIMGQTGYIVRDQTTLDPKQLLEFIADYRINHTIFTPSLLSCILQNIDPSTIQNKLKSLNILWVGGEVMTQDLANQILEMLPDLWLINNYGPAECFVITQGRLFANDSATPSICSVGRVLDDMKVVICDNEMNDCPNGSVGELYATGPCLADGYLNNSELTKRKFIQHNNSIFYKTGDLAKFLEDNRLVIIGRCDETVKIRSYNINMKAIEKILRKNLQISDCVVTIEEDRGDKYLIAYVIRNASSTWEIDNNHSCLYLITYLQKHLPFYSIPKVYIELESFPVHPISQKLDKSSLPIPHYKIQKINQKFVFHEIPDIKQKQILVMLIKEILTNCSVIDEENDFFEIGLHSILAVRLATRIREVFDIEIPVAKIYENSTVRNLLSYLNDQNVNTAILWDKEISAEYDISRCKQTKVFSLESEAVLLTGATGFLGVFLLKYLLTILPKVKVYCLVRSKTLDTIIDKLQHYQLWEEEFHKRILVVEGDLEKPLFGWSKRAFEQRAKIVDAVFHAGAWVNMVYPYKNLKKTNVDGTKEVVRFASCVISKPLHYISTLGVFPSGDPSVYKENRKIEKSIDKLDIGYFQSKWVAERIVWEAVDRNIPVQIYRMSNLGPDRQTFQANSNDFITNFISACKDLKIAPKTENWKFECTPVDFVAESIVRISLCKEYVSNVYHIAAQNLVSAKDVFSKMKEQGHINNLVSFDFWIDSLRGFNHNAKYNVLEQILLLEKQFLLEQKTFSNPFFLKQIHLLGLSFPKIDEQYLINSVVQ
ncbi:thioester reductase domain-containing protein [Candidatus Uabimicrobium sp. HlEnr_7]|uniref:non-ribosomal peptide synthetase n=1 Tax=Candidatus Uabimicrobium helgolandensis TaxID=3095367 RepID=UPI0035582B10